jgi:aryl-alcohol dehydrogenase-like predicted oxidoreductase
MLDFTTTDTTTEEHEFVEILNALQEQIKQGEIRFIGLSNDTAWGLMSYVRLSEKYNLPRIVSVQNEFSLMQRHDDPFVAEVCVRENIAYLPWSPLSSGMLSGKYANGARPIGSRWHFDSRKSARDTPRSHNVVDKYLAVAKKHGLDSCQMALAFCRQQNFVTSTIIGATSLMQLQNNIDACDLTLSLECLKDIDTVYREHPMPF